MNDDPARPALDAVRRRREMIGSSGPIETTPKPPGPIRGAGNQKKQRG